MRSRRSHLAGPGDAAHGRPRGVTLVFLSGLSAASAHATSSLAAEPHLPGEPRLMREPSEPMIVSDAFDDDDPFDLEVALGFEVEVARAGIGREQGSDVVPVARFSRVTSRLLPRVEIGLYRDLAATLRFPVVLSDTRELSPPRDTTSAVIEHGEEVLVRLPMKAVERSGLEYVGFGLRGAPLSQARARDMPTWLVAVEVRLALGPTMRACDASPPAGQVACADPADVDRDGVRDPGEPELEVEPGAGLARQTAGLHLSSVVGRRVRYVEPYGALEALIEVPLPGSLFHEIAGGDALPPVRGSASLGLAVIPWENRERFSRITFDGRATASFVTEGLDYTEVFDAVGASDATSLRVLEGGRGATGLTTRALHAAGEASLSLTWQASQVVKLGAGAGVRYEQSHAVAADAEGDGAYRASLAGAGERIVVTHPVAVDFGARLAVMF